MVKRILAVGLWLGAAALVAGSIRGGQKGATPPLFPEPGELVPIPIVEEAFGTQIPRSAATWLLAVTTDCSACLNLDTELVALSDAAACAGASLMSLVIQTGPSSDSIAQVLNHGGLQIKGLSDSYGFTALKVRSVPVVVAIDSLGVVTAVHHPLRPPWPPEPAC